MTFERVILIIVWGIGLILIPLTIPKDRMREAALVFLANQMITWTLSVLFVEMGLFENPVREFPKAAGINFTNNYLLYPLSSTLFYLYYPKEKSPIIKVLYQACYVAVACIYVQAIATYTNLFKYVHFNAFYNGLVFFLGINAARFYGYWFFKKSHGEG
ncbi:CBO0543 family protein [Paenibacillus sp. GCM10027628]|uniref:CBO0543 family protein n=1 Tax=Paenibacillus sp. GCM10027628 TaxID=3273413 RepID=UPI003637EE40